MSINTMNSGRQQQQHSGNGNSLDFEQLRHNYKSALSELTFNSKPIITNLTIMAQENQAAASIIVREIENQLRNNASGQKLPVLYLIDSICKNVGGVYITNFARNMVNVFLDAYTLTDSAVRKSFERLLQTWKNGMPGGHAVFPRHIIEPIERSIQYIHEKTPVSRYPPSHNNNTTITSTSTSTSMNASRFNKPPVNNTGIHVNPNFIQKDRINHTRDPRNRDAQMTAKTTTPPMSSSNLLLSQLQSMLPNQTTSSGNDPVTQIISQIKAILPTLPPAQASSIEQYLSQITIASPSLSAATPIATTSVQPPIAAAKSSPVIPQPFPNTANSPTPPLHNATLSPVVPTTANKVDTADLLKSLTSMGYLSPSPPIAKPSPPPSLVNTNNDPSQMSLESLGPFLLDSKDLQIPRPGAIELLYSAEPLQCKQCGFRYPKTDKGQAKMDAHLDSHFRQNRKMKERVKRGLSRSWFVTEEEWINGEGGELMSQQAPAFLHDGMGHVSQKSTEKSNQPNHEETINPDQYTVIMPDDDMRKPCAICGERFIDFWNDDEEEWMYKNAVLIDGKIYHATCHADAVQSGTLVEADTDMQDVHSNLKRKLNDAEENLPKQPRLE